MSDDDRHKDIIDKIARKDALKKKRQDEVTDGYNSLSDSLPVYKGAKVKPPRHQILKEAADYIQSTQANNSVIQQEIKDLKKENRILEDQIVTLKKAKETGNFAAASAVLEAARISSSRAGPVSGLDGDSEDSSDESKEEPLKRLKPN